MRGTHLRVARSYTFNNDGIDCAVNRAESDYARVMSVWSHDRLWSEMRLAYEMIPYLASMPKSTKIGQLLLVPAVGDAPAKAYRNEAGNQVLAPEIQVRSKPTENGWPLDALVPFSLLAINPAKDLCLLEFQVTTASMEAKGQRTPMHITLFKSRLTYLDNFHHARVHLKRDPALPPPEVKK